MKSESAPDIQRSPPNSDAAEMGILSCMLQAPDVNIPAVLREVHPGYFYSPPRRTLFQVMCDLWEGRHGIDLITFTQVLMDRKLLDEVGGAGAVTELQVFATPANLNWYIEIAREKYLLRQMIHTGTQMVRAAYGSDGSDGSDNLPQMISDFAYKVDRIRHDVGGPNGSELFSWDEIEAFDSRHDPDCLVGNRWLTRGDAALWAGGSGYGKSSLAIQMIIYWACGQPCFGLRPVRPLKSLIVQAENNLGDVSEQCRGVCAGIAAVGDLDTSGELMHRNVVIHRVIGKTGFVFLGLLEQLIERERPDLVWIDPLFAFAGCDLLNAEKTGRFLREGLFPLGVKRMVGINVIHHAGKPKQNDNGNEPVSEIDYQYLGFGTSEIQNAFRAVNVLIPCQSGIFKLVMSKRGDRSGAKDLSGNPARKIFLEYSKNGICWLQCEEPEGKRGRALVFRSEDILDDMSVCHPIKTHSLWTKLYRDKNMGRRTFFSLWAKLKNEGLIEEQTDGWIRCNKSVQ
jgi:hypothetical protein